MSQKKTLVGWAFVISILLLLLIFGDLLALSDIKNDYVSTTVLETQNINLIKSIPEWTAAKMEWTFVKVSLFLKLIISIIIIISLARAIKNLKLQI